MHRFCDPQNDGILPLDCSVSQNVQEDKKSMQREGNLMKDGKANTKKYD